MNKLFKNGAALVLAGIAVLSFYSCKKHDDKPTVTNNITVRLVANESYNLPLTTGDADDLYAITTQATHQKRSEVTGSATDAPVYHYMPAQDYKGTDNVVLALQENHPNHNGGIESEVIYNINIVVADSAAH